jgi:Tfp pilus assembly protein PilZ
VTRLANENLQATVASSLDPFMRSPAERAPDGAPARARAPSTTSARFAESSRVVCSLADERALDTAWHAGLEHGRLFATSPDPPELGTRVTVELRVGRARWSFLAQVSHVMSSEAAQAWRREPGAGLRLLDFVGSRRREVEDLLPR